jgi:hypothetical protein
MLRLTVQVIFRTEHVKRLVVYWPGKGYPANKMHQKPLVHGGGVSPAYSTLKNWIRILDRKEDIFSRASWSGCLADEDTDGLLVDVLEESPFH